MKYLLFSFISLLFIAGCTTTKVIPIYGITGSNYLAIKKKVDKPISIETFADSYMQFDNWCRGGIKIVPPNGMSYAQYISNALTEELKMAEVYSDTKQGVILSGRITDVSFSSMGGAGNSSADSDKAEETKGSSYWDITIAISSSNGSSASISERYKFITIFFGNNACDHAANSFMYMTQMLINKLVNSDDFVKLIM